MHGDHQRVRTAATVGTYAVAALALIGGGAAFSYHYDVTMGVERRDVADALGDAAYAPSYQVEPGEQLVMVYVGSSTCPWSTRPDLPEAVETIKTQVAAYAAERGLSFKAEGVALEWSTSDGIQHLANFGRFDEVSAGYNWGNSFALNHLWAGSKSAPATPLVLVYRRTFVAPRSEEDEMLYAERNRRVLDVAHGFMEIMDWAESEAWLPELQDSQAS